MNFLMGTFVTPRLREQALLANTIVVNNDIMSITINSNRINKTANAIDNNDDDATTQQQR
jgi:hypothetical protein